MEILKNKLFIITSMFLLLILGISTSSFATINATYNDVEYEFPDPPIVEGYTNFTIFDDTLSSGPWFHLALFPDTMTSTQDFFDFKLDTSTPSNVYNYWSGKSKKYYKRYTLDTESNTWVISNEYSTGEIKNMIYSTVDFYDAEGNVLFQKAPLMEKTQLAQIVEQAETEKTLVEVVEILPLILMIIVGLIGLRKALALLRRVLQQS